MLLKLFKHGLIDKFRKNQGLTCHEAQGGRVTGNNQLNIIYNTYNFLQDEIKWFLIPSNTEELVCVFGFQPILRESAIFCFEIIKVCLRVNLSTHVESVGHLT